MTSTCEPSRSTSSSTWLETITQRPFGAEAAEERDHVGALARVEAGQRLVEDEHRRVVDERLRDLDALAHPLRVRGQPARVGRVELDQLERGGRCRVGVGQAVQHGGERDELVRRQRLEDALLLRHEPDRAA